ncbi:HAMP domain-containing sensor histidine kinase [Sphaerisporangium sp. TRM90804]|uniref:sensor histidine kinase n=1 Tax=Sphaerisporangium sp. TRM90804 TaxID=3031113 RepID=UPI00244A6931|nr:HAMP domain-containing sensor histidine kinase [Sphaerisporangium sp. TRM90804]MDH2425623.1 HAMP domain-containing sensor histidine kinase [Sphaerisporangium sp. TRM90804]
MRRRPADPERHLLTRARRRITAQVAGVFSLAIALLGALVYYVVVDDQDATARRDLAVAARSAPITHPPPCVWLFELRQDTVWSSPGAPRGFPVRGALDRVAAGGRTRVEVVEAGGQTYLVRTQRRGGVPVQAVMDLYFPVAERQRLLRTLCAAEVVALLAALLIGQILARRAIAPLGEALDRQRRFTSDVSHELRTPLTRLHVRAQLAARRLRREPDPQLIARDVDQLVTGIGQLGEVIEDLLLSSQLKRHRRSFGLTDLAALAEESAAAEAARAEARGVTIGLRRGPGDHVVRGAQPSLRRVISALLDNALRHTSQGGHIWLTVGSGPETVRLSVRDDGVGLDPRDGERLFARHVGEPHAGGLGIGLALVSEVMDAHGGTVDVDGRPGAGATFTIRLPRATPDDRAPRLSRVLLPQRGRNEGAEAPGSS